jgi:nitrate/TMAO reductase-like tetraheme cytochrome c subunit
MLSGPNGNNWPNVTSANWNTSWCANCHTNNNTTVHGGNHTGSSILCYSCHIVIPHGGRMSRLIGDRDTMPARYAYGNTLTNMQIQSFNKKAAGSYVQGDCQAACTGTHGTATVENW